MGHIAGMTALHQAFKSPDYEKLSIGARALFTFICAKSAKYGCVFYRLDKVAKLTGLHRRILCLKRQELEDDGWITTRYVRRGNRLPSGEIASRETAVFRAVPRGSRSVPSDLINDPAMINHDRGINDQHPETPFCDLLDLVEDLDVAKTEPQIATAPHPTHPEPLEPLALRILQQWRYRLMPTIVIDPESGRSWLQTVMARLREGFTERQCFAAIEAHYHSPHNQTWKRRTIAHVFDDPVRLRRMAEIGVSIPPPPSGVKKIAPRQEPELPMDEYMAEVERQRKLIEEENSRGGNQSTAG